MNKLLNYILEKIYEIDSSNLIRDLISIEKADVLNLNPESYK